MTTTSEKSRRYILLLDTARCNGNWHEVPEILRKVSKHAPERKCLMQTAQAECQIASHVSRRTASRSRPGTSTSTTEPDLLSLIPTLLSAIEAEGNPPEDVFQAQVCLGWLHWELSEPALAASRLPKDFDTTLHVLSGDGQAMSPWTEVCVAKAGYMKGTAQALIAGNDDAIRTLKSISTWISNSIAKSSSNPQLSFWTERLLAKSAILPCELAYVEGPQASERIIEFALRSFRLWSSHPKIRKGDPTPASDDGRGSPGSPTAVWRAYYDFLSWILQRRMPYIAPSEGPDRGQFSSEFRRVETMCENILLQSTKFPKADSKNEEVENWVEEVIQNWEVLCGPDWCDEDFGEGGQDAISRNVLDILYRAATKTFHSTLILRRLFHVHSALAEFELALKALDTYIHLVTNAQSRAEEAGKSSEDIEDAEIFVRTLSESIITLCCFGNCNEAEKAKQLTELLEKSLLEKSPESSSSHNSSGISPTTLSLAYRAIGIGLGNWARWTPKNESRSEIQAAAIAALERSLCEEWGQDTNPASIFALSLLLSETRDLNGAIDRIRIALSSAGSMADENRRFSSRSYTGERDLVPLWHLLSLLLSAREEFEASNNVCDAVFESMMAEKMLKKRRSRQSLREPQHGNEKAPEMLLGGGFEEKKMGKFENTEAREKESIIELRMTQLRLIEVLHGPEAALNHSNELLGLFGSLFANIGLKEPEKKRQTEHLVPPKSSAGTVRSFRGSIFGRKKSRRTSERGTYDTDTPRVVSTSTTREPPADVVAPSIQVTDDTHGSPGERPRTSGTRKSSLRHEGRSPQKLHRREGSLTKAIRHRSLERSPKPLSQVNEPQGKTHRRQDAEGRSSVENVPLPATDVNGSVSAKQTLPPVPHNMKYKKEPPPVGHAAQPPQQDVRLPTAGRFGSATKAVTRFPRAYAQKHAIGLLVKIWLFISGLYRRALLFEDALEACNEALQQASKIEALVAEQESSARAFADPGWGGSKSSDEVWADVYAEYGHLAQARSQPFEAIKHFEEAVMYFPDHIRATVGLTNLLLDIYEQKMPAEEPEPTAQPDISNLSLSPAGTDKKFPSLGKEHESNEPTSSSFGNDTPESLNRLAARDRAYGLLSTLTKLGTAWDDSEAWFGLARAYEQGGQIDKAKEVLWWCVELEDRQPIRHWWNVGSGGYVL